MIKNFLYISVMKGKKSTQTEINESNSKKELSRIISFLEENFRNVKLTNFQGGNSTIHFFCDGGSCQHYVFVQQKSTFHNFKLETEEKFCGPFRFKF